MKKLLPLLLFSPILRQQSLQVLLGVLVSVLLLVSVPARADLEAFSCEPEWASLLNELGGDHVNVALALTAAQDPHYLQAKPSLIAAIRKADMIVCSGAQLEVGWLPLLLRRSGNSTIQPGAEGYIMTALLVRRLEIPQVLDRSQGDIHPEGNPHVQLNPDNVARIATELGRRLASLDPEQAAYYKSRSAQFLDRWKQATRRWRQQIKPLAGMPVIVHHSSFSYLADYLKLDVVADLEPKPGLPPSAAHLASLLARFGDSPPAAIIRTPYADSKPSQWLSERLNIPAVTLPYTVGGLDSKDLIEVFDRTIALLLEVRK